MSKEVSLYGGLYTLTFSEGSHRYKVNGEYKNGVTTMLGLLGKEGLIQWAANCAVEALQNGDEPQEAKYAWMKKRDKAGDVGTRVHAWIEEHIKGNNSEVSEDMRPSVEAFLQWESTHQPEYAESERMVYSAEFDYCGTVDCVAVIDGKRVVLDFKTGEPDKEYKAYEKRYTGKLRARTEHFMQDSLYDQAILEEDGVSAEVYGVVYVTKEGKTHYFTTDKVEQVRNTALSLVNFYKAHKSLEKENEYE